MVGNKFTLADIYVTCYLWNNYRSPSKIKKYGATVLDDYAPTLAKHIQKIKDNELKEFFNKGFIYEEDPNEMAIVAEFMRTDN